MEYNIRIIFDRKHELFDDELKLLTEKMGKPINHPVIEAAFIFRCKQSELLIIQRVIKLFESIECYDFVTS